MDLYIFDKDLNYIDHLDTFSSLMWIRRFHTTGSFELHCSVNNHSINTLIRNNLIWKQDSKEVGIVEYRNLSIDEEGRETLKVMGRFFTSVLDRRILYTTEQYTNKQVEVIMRNMVNNNCINTDAKRKLPIILGSLNNFPERIDYQKSYGNLLEELSILSQTTGIGFLLEQI